MRTEPGLSLQLCLNQTGLTLGSKGNKRAHGANVSREGTKDRRDLGQSDWLQGICTQGREGL